MHTRTQTHYEMYPLKGDKISEAHLFNILFESKCVVPVLAERPSAIVNGVAEHPKGVDVTVRATLLGQDVFRR